MSTHNICFYWEIRKISVFFGWKKRLICCYEALSPHSLISLHCLHEETLYPWLSGMHHRGFWSDCAKAQANLELPSVYIRCFLMLQHIREKNLLNFLSRYNSLITFWVKWSHISSLLCIVWPYLNLMFQHCCREFVEEQFIDSHIKGRDNFLWVVYQLTVQISIKFA